MISAWQLQDHDIAIGRCMSSQYTLVHMPRTCDCTAAQVAIVSPLNLCDKQQLLVLPL